eukprot:4501471-Amphidinium_carterae.1
MSFALMHVMFEVNGVNMLLMLLFLLLALGTTLGVASKSLMMDLLHQLPRHLPAHSPLQAVMSTIQRGSNIGTVAPIEPEEPHIKQPLNSRE